jgi:hypothetical protein
MLRNLVIGLPTMLVCLTLQAGFTFWSVRFYMGQNVARARQWTDRAHPAAADRRWSS